MCRHLAYLGPPTPVGELLTRGPYSLRTQSWAPREMRGGGTINADGFGVAWWHLPDAATPDTGPGVIWHGGAPADGRVDAHTAAAPARPVVEPTERAAAQPNQVRGDGEDVAGLGGGVAFGAGRSGMTTRSADPVVSRYRNAAPIWTDPAVDEVLPQLRSTAVLAAIRSATVGMPVERAACAPFTHGRWAFSHNGAIPDWRRVLTEVAEEFGSPPLLEAESLTDSAALWVILRGLLEGGAGNSSGTTRPATAGASAAAPEADPSSEWGSGGPAIATAAGEASSGRSESHGYGATVAFGSTVSITSTSGAPPEVRAWGWAATSESGRESFGGDAVASSSVSEDAGSRHGYEFAGGGLEPGEALRRVIAAVLARSPKARLNLLLGDGVGVWGSTWHHSLAVLERDGFVVVASEPFDDDSRWRPVGDRQLVRVVGGRVAVEPLDIEIGRAGS